MLAAGVSGLDEAASLEAEWVMAAIVGTAGLAPTLKAASRGADIALANKECLVSAGELFVEAVRAGGGRLIPVDSEHSAIFQCLDKRPAARAGADRAYRLGRSVPHLYPRADG